MSGKKKPQPIEPFEVRPRPNKPKSGTLRVARDSHTGQFVTKKYALKNPSKVRIERVKRTDESRGISKKTKKRK